MSGVEILYLRGNCMKKKEEKIFAICIMMVCILILIVQCMINFPGFNYWITHDHGSVADWIGGVGTILAIVGGFQQINKQHKVDEAEKIEKDRKSTRLNSSHVSISYAVFCLIKHTGDVSVHHGARLQLAPVALRS